MKEYATLKLEDKKYELLDENGATLVRGELPHNPYIWEKPKIFNILARKGWSLEQELQSGQWVTWYLVSRIL